MGRGQRNMAETLTTRNQPLALASARRGNLAAACAELQELPGNGGRTLALRKHSLAALAEATIDNYQERWNDKLLPFINQLGLPGDDAESALGQAPSRWPEGYRGCALKLAKDGLIKAANSDNKLLAAGKREKSRLTPSWVAENIATGWRDTYLSALLDRLNADKDIRRLHLETTAAITWPQLCRGWRDFSRAQKKGQSISGPAAIKNSIAAGD